MEKKKKNPICGNMDFKKLFKKKKRKKENLTWEVSFHFFLLGNILH